MSTLKNHKRNLDIFHDRKDKCLTFQELADKYGISRTHAYRICEEGYLAQYQTQTYNDILSACKQLDYPIATYSRIQNALRHNGYTENDWYLLSDREFKSLGRLGEKCIRAFKLAKTLHKNGTSRR